jgi:ABC-2 type transport system permease protein
VNRILTIARKEFLQLRRDRRTLPMIIGMPIIQLLIFGYAANMDLRDVRLALVDRARTPVSRAIGRALDASGTFRVFGVPDRRAIERSMLEGDAKVGVLIPAGFDRNLLAGRPSGLEVYADGSEPNTAVVGAGYVQGVVARVLADRFAGRLPAAASAGARLVPRVLYNPDLRSRNYMIPGVVVLILMLMTTIMTAMAIVREYERGTIEQLAVTPVRPHELLAGKLLPYIIIGYGDVLLITTVATALFGVPVRGSLPLLFVLAGPFLLATLGLGILTSTVARTQQQAMMLSFLTLMPNILLSGYMFPIENMPVAAQYLTRVIPARYFMTISRAIFLKGTGLQVLWPDALALLGLGAVIFAIAVARYRRPSA